MKLAALYSGGKDSALSVYIAEQMGHDVEYIVNIVSDSGDSMIFHVPNTDAVPLLASSMGKRLITSVTNGDADDDMDALRRALSGLDIDGVVMGAVLSDYQWERMNIICGELDLVCLAPLWRKDPDMIMEDLIDSGISAIIVGVYAEGLDDCWLGKNICDSYSELKELCERKERSVIGEGGEYETLTLDSPMQAAVLEIKETEKEWNGRSGTLHVRKAELREKVRGPF